MMQRLFNVSLRGGGMLGKFLLIFFLARILPPEELGLYGLLTVTVGYALYLLGLDFYSYAGRAMLHVEQKEWPNMLRDQIALFTCSYLLVFPLLGLLFFFDLLPEKYILVFYILLTVEHLSQELNRLLIIMGKPLAAGICIFIRSGAWCYVLVSAYLVGFTKMDLSTVLWLWIVADCIVIMFGIWLLRKLAWAGFLTSHIDWVWIYKGLKVAALFFVGTLAIRGVFTLDRYFVEIVSGAKMLGVYTLFLGVCNSINNFVDAAVFSFRYPALVTLYKNGEYAAFKKAKRDFSRQTLLAVTILSLFAGLLITPLLDFIGKPIYLKHLSVFFILLGASVFHVISYIPHYILYAMGHDRSIVNAHKNGFVAFIVFSMILAPTYEIIGIATALFIAVLVVGATKQWKVASLGWLERSMHSKIIK